MNMTTKIKKAFAFFGMMGEQKAVQRYFLKGFNTQILKPDWGYNVVIASHQCYLRRRFCHPIFKQFPFLYLTRNGTNPPEKQI